ncbi:MAG: TolC family protein [Campylobacteraceae bacterium]|nr:TolC family protein [Campylobacteraceae bacterium]
MSKSVSKSGIKIAIFLFCSCLNASDMSDISHLFRNIGNEKFLNSIDYSANLTTPDNYTFDSLLSHTLKNSANIALSKLEVDSSLNELNYNKSSFYPEIGISANTEYSKRFDDGYNSIYVGKDNLASSTSYSNSVSLVLNYDLYTFGSDSLKVKSSKESIEKAKYEKCAYELETALKLLDAYYKALELKNKIETYEALKKAYETLYVYQKRLSGAGEVSKIELGESAMIVADTSYELNELELNANHSINLINQITGLKIDDVRKLNGFSMDMTNKEFAKFEDTFIAKKFDYELKANEYAKEAEERSYYPTISLYARYDLYGNDRDNYWQAGRELERHGYRVGLSFYVSLFDGGKKEARIKGKEIDSEKIRLQKEVAKLEYEKEVADLKLFLSSKDKVGKVLKELDTLSKESYSMQTKLNKAKENSKVDVINSLIVALKKELSYKEHALKAGYNITKANLMSKQGVCE